MSCSNQFLFSHVMAVVRYCCQELGCWFLSFDIERDILKLIFQPDRMDKGICQISS